ncbi:hypothetical protein FA15DRAFT_663393 [Coprinopsis marcescibilis]|uniref:CSN8/PSMD8/EIF3K domain-containing protein n=1 Tax=Coprinopsis marcescibilis TaxID=230819 RepID=A0A5C3LBD6_COPMA|nr:hypothetical protein FA15DRAFT_663393 [Coprinopsis marcescibilis]
MVGPPTPPPVTSEEIREAAQAQATISSAHSNYAGPDPYQVAFPQLMEAVSRNDYRLVSSRAEDIDLTTTGDVQVTRLLVVAPLVLSYLIEDNIPPARQALERLPGPLSDLPLVKLLATLTSVTQARQHAQVYATVALLHDLLNKPDFFDQELAMILTKLVAQFAENFRTRTFRLLSGAYSSLHISLAEEYLGVSTEAIINEANKYNWKYESPSEILLPEIPEGKSNHQSSISSLSTFNLVANSVAALEA